MAYTPNPTATEQQSPASVELELWLMNDYGAYAAYYLPRARSLAKHWRNNDFDLDLGIKLMRYCANDAAKQYNTEHGSMSVKWSDVFSVKDRDQLAESLARSLVDEFKLGWFKPTDWKA